MSPKELLYIEDALGHEKQLNAVCKEYVSKLQDPELKTFVENLCSSYTQSFNKLYGLISQ